MQFKCITIPKFSQVKNQMKIWVYKKFIPSVPVCNWSTTDVQSFQNGYNTLLCYLPTHFCEAFCAGLFWVVYLFAWGGRSFILLLVVIPFGFVFVLFFFFLRIQLHKLYFYDSTCTLKWNLKIKPHLLENPQNLRALKKGKQHLADLYRNTWIE